MARENRLHLYFANLHQRICIPSLGKGKRYLGMLFMGMTFNSHLAMRMSNLTTALIAHA